MKLAGDGAVSFSNKPLKLPFVFGIITAVLSLCYLIVSIVLAGLNILDITHILFSVVFLLISGLFISLGIFGLYIGRIYDESKNRPIYIIDEQINF